jgi:hypothetical protein
MDGERIHLKTEEDWSEAALAVFDAESLSDSDSEIDWSETTIVVSI